MLSFMLALTLFAQSPEIKGKPAQFITVSAPSLVGEVVKFVTLDDLSVFPSDLLTDKKKTVVVASKAGNYKIIAYTANNNIPSDPVIITLIVSENDDAKPVNPPAPQDEILSAILAASKAETSPTKTDDIIRMSYVLKCSMQLAYENLSDFEAYLKKNLAENPSKVIKKAVSDMIAKELGTDDAKMDEVLQTKVNKFIQKIADALDKAGSKKTVFAPNPR